MAKTANKLSKFTILLVFALIFSLNSCLIPNDGESIVLEELIVTIESLPSKTQEEIPPTPSPVSQTNLITENYYHILSIPVASRNYSEISRKYLSEQLELNTHSEDGVFSKVGDHSVFTVHNDDDDDYYQINAVLLAETDHALFWIQNNLDVSRSEAQRILSVFEEKIYPTNIRYFGAESNPGIDGDPHIYIFYTTSLGTFVGGYFSANDTAPKSFNEYSNEHEMIYINADTVSLEDDLIFQVIAHEFQHMIHFNQDRNEETWINEGASEYAAYLNGFYSSWETYSYLVEPDIPLTEWTEDMSDSSPFYAGGFLFAAYFAERFGAETMQSLVRSKSTGLSSITEVLHEVNTDNDPSLTYERILGDWAIANLINDSAMEGGRYSYKYFPLPTRISMSEQMKECPCDAEQRTVNQFGVDYIKIGCEGELLLEFVANESVRVLNASAHSGEFAMWSNRGNESSMSMTREFDFSSVMDVPITLSYASWYDIEEQYDYVYVLASTDLDNWDVLHPEGCLAGRHSFGCGLTGSSEGWIQTSVDLTEYSGKKVYIQFEYLTDLAVNGEGFMIDDIEIDAINYREDFESDSGGWSEDGFVRMTNHVPQFFEVALVLEGDENKVTRYDYLPGSTLTIPLLLDEQTQATLIVIGTTPFTKLQAEYSIAVIN